MNKKYKKIFFYAGVLVLVFALFSPSLFGTTINIGYDGSDTWSGGDEELIRNSAGKVWSATSANIQNAIDDLSSGGTVFLPPGFFETASGFETNDVVVVGSGFDTQINLSGTATITVECGGGLRSLKVKADSGYSDTAVLVDSDGIDFQFYTQVLDDLIIKSDALAGKGLVIRADSTDASECVALNSFGSIIIDGFQYGLQCYASESAQNGYVNGNIFESLVLRNQEYMLYLNSSGDANVGGNIFHSVMLQPNSSTVNGISLVGSCGMNSFLSVIANDWADASGNALQINGGNNNVYANGYFRDSIVDNGDNNIIIDTYTDSSTVSPYKEIYFTDEDLRLYLPFSMNTGSVAYDRSIYSYDGSITGATWCDGKFGTGLSFDGSGDYVNCTNGYDPTDNDFTIMGWFKSNDTASDKYIISKWSGSGTEPMVVVYVHADGKVYFSVRDDDNDVGSAATSLTYEDEVWHFFVAKKNSTYISIYVDNVLGQCVNVASLDSVTCSEAWFVGAGTTGGYAPFSGDLDEIKVFDYNLSFDELHSHYLFGLQSHGYLQSDNFTVFDSNWAEYMRFPTTNSSTLLVDGQSWFNSASNVLSVYNGTAWVTTTLT